MSTQLDQIAKKAKLDRKVRFTSLAHLLTPAFLKETWGMLNHKAASGVDGESIEQPLGRLSSSSASTQRWIAPAPTLTPKPAT